MRARWPTGLLCSLLIGGGTLAAQSPIASSDSTNRACLTLNGVRIGADWGDSTSRLQVGGVKLDTTLRFDVAERQWSRPELRAYVAGAVSGHVGRPSPSQATQPDWHACVGITLAMQQPTLVMRGVRGQVHFKIDLTPLSRIPGATLDTSRQNQSRRR